MSKKDQESGSSCYKCEHRGKPIPKNEEILVERMVISHGQPPRAFVAYHKNRKECFEASGQS
jgi:hypothetical protein